MLLKTEVEKIVPSKENFGRSLTTLRSSLDFLDKMITEMDKYLTQKQKIIHHYQQLQNMYISQETIGSSDINAICEKLDLIIEQLYLFDTEKAIKISDMRLSWDPSSIEAWYQKGKIGFQLFVEHKVDDIENTAAIFDIIIKQVEERGEHKELAFWSYCFIGNLYLYQILTGEEALEKALKHYNQAYRYAKSNDVDVDDAFIFENVDILQKILMNQYPLLIVIYNDSGLRMYDYLFQFIEVMTEDKRFIPNLTGLLSAVDSGIDELFRAPISSSYIVIQNRLMILSTLFEKGEKNWVKIAMVFSYLHQSAYNVEIDHNLLEKVKEFDETILNNPIVSKYLHNYNGRQDDAAYDEINRLISEVFSEAP